MMEAKVTVKTEQAEQGASLLAIFGVFLKLGLTSFGGPIAHLGYFRREFVERRKWLDEVSYADIVALCQFLPGPASSQVGIAIGISRAGLPGALAAWLGFTMPSALALIAFAYGFETLGLSANAGWLHGLKIAAVAVVAQAVWGMGKNLAPDRFRATLALAATLVVFAWPTATGQIAAILLGALVGWRFLPPVELKAPPSVGFPISRGLAIFSWLIFFVFFALLFLLSPIAHLMQSHTVAVFDSFYRSGSLVFGGGHVVLPLLHNAVVPPGWVDDGTFLAGYGAAQAVPGPLFTFAAYLGAVMKPQPNGIAGGMLCLAAIFLPSFLLVVGALPYWEALRHRTAIQSALRGINAAVVGILLAALYNPVWTSSIHTPFDFALAAIAFVLLMFWKLPPLWVVAVCAIGGAVLP